MFSVLYACITLAAFLSTYLALVIFRLPPREAARRWGGLLAAALAVQAALLLAGERELMLTLIPVTVYLPMVLCIHRLSTFTWFQSGVVWSTAALVGYILNYLRKYLLSVAAAMGQLGSRTYRLAILAALALAAAGLLTVVYRWLRAPFRRCVGRMDEGWLAMAFPTVLAFLLMSYLSSSASSPTALLFVLLAGVSIFLVFSRVLVLSVSLREARDSEHEVRRQMDLQRRDYDAVVQKTELERIYRHDVRHHLTVLDNMLQQRDLEGARRYVQDLSRSQDSPSQPRWCANNTVNAVLSAYVSQAERAGCAVEAGVRIPAQLPFDETDLCVVLANALENAIHACQALPAKDRRIALRMTCTGNQRLTVSVDNPCPQPVQMGEDGLPPDRGNHGLGLRSIRAVAEKYGGLFRCRWEAGRFYTQAVLFPPLPADAPSRREGRGIWITAALVSAAICCLFLNGSPGLLDTLEELPVLGPGVRVLDLRTYGLGQESAQRQDHRIPSGGGAALDGEAAAFAGQMEEAFLQYVGRRYADRPVVEVDWAVTPSSGPLLVLRFNGVVSGGDACRRYVVLDRAAGRVLTLPDLFLEETDYVSLLSREVQAQMAERIRTGKGSYYLPGDIWPEADCFREIAPDQDFYIDGEGRLVIAFEADTVAPGAMGSPEFAIPGGLLEGVLARPDLLTDVE